MVVPPTPANQKDTMSKTDLRRQYRTARTMFVAGLTAAERERLERAMAAMIAPMLGTHTLTSSYGAVASEIDPAWIDADAGPLAFPRVAGPDILFHPAARTALIPGAENLPEPPASAPVVYPDLVLGPLLAVTLSGVRLGQGRGHYDRALALLRARQPVLAIGLAWECQIAPALPCDAWDMPMDMIATPQRLVDCRKNQ